MAQYGINNTKTINPTSGLGAPYIPATMYQIPVKTPTSSGFIPYTNTGSPTYLQTTKPIQPSTNIDYSAYARATGGSTAPAISGGYTAASSPNTNMAVAQMLSGGGGESSGGSYTPMPAYSAPAYEQLQAPNLNWQVSEAMREEWLKRAKERASLKYDPMETALETEYNDFQRVAGENKEATRNQNVVDQLGLANVVKNTMKQDYTDSAIRRGAENSGWLPEMLGKAGQFETEQRTGIQKEANRILESIANQLLNKETEVGSRRSDIASMRGAEEDLYANEAELTAKQDYITNELAKWDRQYQVASLAAQTAYQQGNLQYQYAALEAQKEAEAATRELEGQKFALDQQIANYNMQPKTQVTSAMKPTYNYNLGGTNLSNLTASQYADLFYSDPKNKNSSSSYADKINELLYQQMLKELNQ